MNKMKKISVIGITIVMALSLFTLGGCGELFHGPKPEEGANPDPGPGVNPGDNTIAAPTGLQAAAQDDGSILVTWQAVSGATGYRIYFSTDNNDYSGYGFYSVTVLQYTDKDVVPGETWYYKVLAFKNDGLILSSLSGYASATAKEPPGYNNRPDALIAPTEVVASMQDGAIYVYWQRVNGADGYTIYRNGISYSSVGSIGVFKDTAIPAGTYYYEVSARSSTLGRESPKSNRSNTVMVSNTFAPPANVKANLGSDNKSILLSWDQVPGAVGYRIYRSDLSGYQVSPTTSYTDYSVEAGKTYTYQISAWSSGFGESAKSGATDPITVQVQEVPGDEPTANPFKGTWGGTSEELGYISLVFTDTTFGISEIFEGKTGGANGTYTYSGNTAFLTFSDGQRENVTIFGNTITIWDRTLTKQQ